MLDSPGASRYVRAPLWLALLHAACGARYQAEPLRDGSWRVECEERVDRCLQMAQRTCGDEGYVVEQGKQDTKLYGGETGYQTAVDLHVLEFRCGEQEAAPAAEKARSEREAPESASPGEKLCIPGSTQACVGPGGCRGGQSCNDEGSGFLPCDCGPPASAPAGPAEPEQLEQDDEG